MEEAILESKTGLPPKIQFRRIYLCPFHWHDSLEVIFVLKGSIYISILDDMKILKAGDIEILNFNQLHQLRATSEDNLVGILHIEKGYAKMLDPYISSVWFSHGFSPSIEIDQSVLLMLFRELYHLLGGRQDGTDVCQRDVSRRLVRLIMTTFDVMAQTYGSNSAQLSRIRGVFDLLNDPRFYMSKVTLRDLCISTNEYLNLDYMSALIRSCAGDNFQNLLNYFRIEFAVKQLLSTEKNITEIALECGYSATRYFYKHFKGLFPEGPKEFRRRHCRERREGSYDLVREDAAMKWLERLIAESEPEKERWIALY